MQAAARNLPSRAFGQLHTYLLRDNRQAAGRNLPSRTFGQLHTNLLRDNRQAAARLLPSRAFGQLHTNLLQIKRREVDQNLLPIGGNYRGVGQWESKLFVRRMNFSSCRPTII